MIDLSPTWCNLPWWPPHLVPSRERSGSQSETEIKDGERKPHEKITWNTKPKSIVRLWPKYQLILRRQCIAMLFLENSELCWTKKSLSCHCCQYFRVLKCVYKGGHPQLSTGKTKEVKRSYIWLVTFRLCSTSRSQVFTNFKKLLSDTLLFSGRGSTYLQCVTHLCSYFVTW